MPHATGWSTRTTAAKSRDKQISNLTETKRLIQAGHQATLQAYDKRGCQTTVTVLCLEKDLKVKAMLDTGCSPNNYMREEYFEANKANLRSKNRVDLGTSDSAQYITKHIQLNLRHVDSRGRMRLMTLKFGLLRGLRFDMVIGLYAISFHFMELIQDLLTLQLELIESTNPALAIYTDASHNPEGMD